VDVIGFIIVVLFIVVPFIGVVASRMREMSQPPARPLAQGDNRRIQEQIDEFLRRAGQRRGGPAAAPQQQQAAPVAAEVLEDDQVGTGVGQQVQRFLDTSEFRRRSEAMGEDVQQADEQFTQQVRKAFSGDVSKLSARRGDTAAPPEVEEAEVVAEDPSRPTLEALPAAGSGLAELLGSPDNIAHAIIMNEILRRPEW
jgi:hypothetical protein